MFLLDWSFWYKKIYFSISVDTCGYPVSTEVFHPQYSTGSWFILSNQGSLLTFSSAMPEGHSLYSKGENVSSAESGMFNSFYSSC